MSTHAVAVEHGPRQAGYSNLTWPQTPWIECLCGWESSRGNQCWMTVGEEFDEHIVDSVQGAPDFPSQPEGNEKQ